MGGGEVVSQKIINIAIFCVIMLKKQQCLGLKWHGIYIFEWNVPLHLFGQFNCWNSISYFDLNKLQAGLVSQL